jgi:fucose permease
MPYALLYLLIFAAGMTFSTTGSIIPEVSGTFALTRAQVSSLPLFQFAGGFFGLVLLLFLLAGLRGISTREASRGPARPGTLLSAAILTMAASSFCLAFLKSHSPALLVAFFSMGASMSLIFGLTGVLVSSASGPNAARSLNIHYSFMSAGVVFSPLVYSAFVFFGARYNAVFLLIGGLSAGLGVVTLFVRFPPLALGGGPSIPAVRILTGEFRAFTIVILAMSFCYMGAEAIPNNWIPKYLDDTFPAAAGAADFSGLSGLPSRLVLSLFWAAVTAGRRVCAALLDRWKKPLGLLGVLAFLVFLFLVIVPSIKNRTAAQALLAASGFFYSGMIPIIFSLTGHLPGSLSSVMFILVLTVGMLGASLANKAVGFSADAAGFRAAVMMGALPLFVLIALIPVMRKILSGLGGKGK